VALDNEEVQSSITTTTQASSQPTEPQNLNENIETIGYRARQLCEKHFETKSTKIVNSINKRVLQASGKGLWRVQVKLPNTLWTSDKENQRRILLKLKEGDLAAWIKTSPSSVIVSVSWSQYDLEHPAQTQEDFESSENNEKDKISIEEKSLEPNFGHISERNESAPANIQLFNEIDNDPSGERDESSEIDKEKKKERKLKKQLEKEEFKRLKQQKREAKLKDREIIKQSRKGDRARLKQMMKEKKKEGKKKEDIQKLKELRQQKKLAKQKRKEEKNKGGKKKNQEKKSELSSSSSEDERTSDLSASSDSESQSD